MAFTTEILAGLSIARASQQQRTQQPSKAMTSHDEKPPYSRLHLKDDIFSLAVQHQLHYKAMELEVAQQASTIFSPKYLLARFRFLVVNQYQDTDMKIHGGWKPLHGGYSTVTSPYYR